MTELKVPPRPHVLVGKTIAAHLRDAEGGEMSKRVPNPGTGVVVYLDNGDGYHISEIEKLVAAVPVDKFRDADHLAEWLGSLVAACGQEEWDAAQAAMNGIRAFQNHPDAVERLRAAIEGECDGLAISGQQASAILAHVMLPEPVYTWGESFTHRGDLT